MTAPVCLISGVGPGTGSALARRFTEGGYRVALLARNEARLAALEQQLPGAKAYRCDVSDPAQVEAVASAVERDLGDPTVVIHNAVGGAFGTFREQLEAELGSKASGVFVKCGAGVALFVRWPVQSADNLHGDTMGT